MSAPNHVRAWRKHRGLTQAALATMIGTNGSVVSLLEAGQRRLCPKWLHRLSTALRTPVGAILEHAPDGCADFLDAWAAVPEVQRPLARDILKRLSGNATALPSPAEEAFP